LAVPPLKYHPGQLAIQEEAKTTLLAENLSHWVGPVELFARDADLLLLAAPDMEGVLRFTVLSGEAPVVDVAGDDEPRLQLPAGSGDRLPDGRYGGLVISMARARRVRLNGVLTTRGGRTEMLADESFTLCRKYIAPSVALELTPRLGPTARTVVPIDDAWLNQLVAGAETSFLASISPDGGPDVAHRGGPAGFIRLDPAKGEITWPEFVGDGVFKSAGNVRATGRFTLLVPDFETGDGLELIGEAAYVNTRPERKLRTDALVQHKEAFPEQGWMRGRVAAAYRLSDVVAPRRRLEKALRVTSTATPDVQAPQ
jgi:hypothetical protein